MNQYFREPCNHFSGNVTLEVDLPKYATKSELKSSRCYYKII